MTNVKQDWELFDEAYNAEHEVVTLGDLEVEPAYILKCCFPALYWKMVHDFVENNSEESA